MPIPAAVLPVLKVDGLVRPGRWSMTARAGNGSLRGVFDLPLVLSPVSGGRGMDPDPAQVAIGGLRWPVWMDRRQHLEGYVELAVALMSNDARRLALRERICQAALLYLYDRIEMVRGFEDFASEAITQAKTCQS